MKLNKRILGLAVAAAMILPVTLLCGCASTDDSVKEVVFESDEKTTPEDEEIEEQEVTEDNSIVVTADEHSSFKLEATVPAGKDNKKNYTGWISSSMRPITNVYGNIKLYANPKKGTFAISILNSDEKAVNVMSSANEYTTSSFYLQSGKKIFKLCDDSSVVSAAKKTDKGMRLRYTIERNAVVIIDFECFSSVEGEAEDSIKVTAAIVSLAKKKTDFALKLLFDTVLGETDRHHFYNSEGLPVKGEVIYHTMEEEKYFTSKNAKGSMQMIFAGADTTPVQSVILANFTTLDTKKWEPDMTNFRSFDTVLSYNNSAVGVFWPKTNLEPDAEKDFVFYLSMATGDAVPGGVNYIFAEPEQPEEEAEPAEEQEQTKPQEEKVQNIQAVKEETEPKPSEIPAAEKPVVEKPVETQPVTAPAEPEPVKVITEEPPVQTEPVQKVTDKISDNGIGSDKLSYDYIQKLLDRIDELEEGDPDLNKAEINALNAELDAILTILNSQ